MTLASGFPTIRYHRLEVAEMNLFPENCRDEFIYGVFLTAVGLYFKMYERFSQVALIIGIALLVVWAAEILYARFASRPDGPRDERCTDGED